jgi:hypothetical protein
MIELTDEHLDQNFVAEQFAVRDGMGSVVVHIAVVKPVAEGRPRGGIRFTPTGDPAGELQHLEEGLRA